jgi:TetR/AcrR family transcriptional regulator, transcriptional repressor for nem operon
MRYDSGHKERTRQRVLSEAAAAIRTVGPDGIGVAGLMAKAGLTHGAFYAHFQSKDDLVAQAIAQMFDESYQRFLARTEHPDPAVGLERFIDNYLSARHRDHPQHGCPMPSLTGELARLPGAARENFTAGLNRLTGSIAKRIRELGRSDADRLASSIVAEMVGALSLARAVAEPAKSDLLLEASRRSIRARIGLPAPDTQR